MASPGKGGKAGGSKGGSRSTSSAKPAFKAETSPARSRRGVAAASPPRQKRIAEDKINNADKMRIIRNAKRDNARRRIG